MNNQAVMGNGGALAMQCLITLTIIENTFQNNKANDGGAVFIILKYYWTSNYHQDMNIIKSHFRRNAAVNSAWWGF